MTGLITVISYPQGRLCSTALRTAMLVCALLMAASLASEEELGAPELHLFAVNDLLAEDDPHIPAWLPQDYNLTSRAG